MVLPPEAVSISYDADTGKGVRLVMGCVLVDWDGCCTGETLVVGRLQIDSADVIMCGGADKTHMLLGGGTSSIMMSAV